MDWEGGVCTVEENSRGSDVSEEKMDFSYYLLKYAQKQYPEVEKRALEQKS